MNKTGPRVDPELVASPPAMAWYCGDGTNGDLDNNDKKDLAGRIFVKPLRLTGIDALKELGIGIAATRGTQIGRSKWRSAPRSSPARRG